MQPSELIDAVPPGKWLTSYGRRIRDVSGRGNLKWDQVLRYSKNACMAHVADRMSTTTLRDRVLAFGFGERLSRTLRRGSRFGASLEIGTTSPKRRFVWSEHLSPRSTLQGISILASGGELRPIHLLPWTRFHPHIPVISAATTRPPSKPWFPWLKTPNTSASKASGLWEIGNRPGAAIGQSRTRHQTGMYKTATRSFVMGAHRRRPESLVLCTIDDPDRYALERENRRHTGSYTAGPVAKKVVKPRWVD